MAELSEGERLLGHDGPVTVLSHEVLHRPTSVYNIEVHGEHVYQVGQSAVLVHNNCPGAANSGLGILNPTFVPKPTTLGRVGETLAGITGNKTKILINGRNRIPDGLSKTVLTEIKNVQNLSYTRQLRDFADYAKLKGLRFELYVTPMTKLSGPLLDAIRNGDIILKIIPGI